MPAVIFCLVIGYFIFSSHSFGTLLAGAGMLILFGITVVTSFFCPPLGAVFGFIAYAIATSL